jgi:hypothetical protein
MEQLNNGITGLFTPGPIRRSFSHLVVPGRLHMRLNMRLIDRDQPRSCCGEGAGAQTLPGAVWNFTLQSTRDIDDSKHFIQAKTKITSDGIS